MSDLVKLLSGFSIIENNVAKSLPINLLVISQNSFAKSFQNLVISWLAWVKGYMANSICINDRTAFLTKILQ